MQNVINYSDILATIKTKDDFNLITNELDLLANSIYDLKNSNSSYSEFITRAIKFDSKEEVIKKLEEELKKVKFMEITLSQEPSQNLITMISDLLNKTDQRIAMDIKVDKSILGGATFAYEGKFFDASLKSKLANILKNYI